MEGGRVGGMLYTRHKSDPYPPKYLNTIRKLKHPCIHLLVHSRKYTIPLRHSSAYIPVHKGWRGGGKKGYIYNRYSYLHPDLPLPLSVHLIPFSLPPFFSPFSRVPAYLSPLIPRTRNILCIQKVSPIPSPIPIPIPIPNTFHFISNIPRRKIPP